MTTTTTTATTTTTSETTTTTTNAANNDTGELSAKRPRRAAAAAPIIIDDDDSDLSDEFDSSPTAPRPRAKPKLPSSPSKPLPPGSYRLVHVVKENHNAPIEAVTSILKPATANETDNFVVLSAAADQASAYRARHMDMASHFANQANDYTKGGPIRALCVVRVPSEDVVLAVGGDEGVVVVISIALSRAVALLKGHKAPITRLVTHPSRDHIVASLGRDDAAMVWNVTQEAPLFRLDFSNDRFSGRALAFYNDLLVLSFDHVLRMYDWSAQASEPRKTVASAKLVEDLCVFPGPTFFCLHAGGSVSAFDEQGPLSVGLGKAFKAACVCQQGDWVAVGQSEEGASTVLQLVGRAFATTGQIMKSKRVKTAVTALSFGPTSDVLFVGTSDGLLLKWQKTA